MKKLETITDVTVKKRKRMPAFAYLNAARWNLVLAGGQDESVSEFRVRLSDGRIITPNDLHSWLVAASDHFEAKAEGEGLQIFRQRNPRRGNGQFRSPKHG